MCHTASGCQDGAEKWVATAAQTYAFTSHGIFLRGEFQGDEGGGSEAADVGGEGVEARRADKKGYILQVERLRLAGGSCIFSWTEEKKETQADHVGDGKIHGGVCAQGLLCNVVEDGDGNRFNTQWRGVQFSVSCQHAL